MALTRHAFLVLVLVLLSGVSSADTASSAAAQDCQPSVLGTVTPLAVEGGEVLAVSVALRAAATGGRANQLTAIEFAAVTNAVVEVGGRQINVPSRLGLTPLASSWTFEARKVTRGVPFHVTFAASDLCGDVQKFTGAGMGAAGSNPVQPVTSTPSPSPTAVPSPTPTATPTSSVVPRATVPTLLSMFYHPPKDGTPLQILAQRFASAVFTHGDEGYRDQLRAAGFSGPVLQYLMANEASGPAGLRFSSDPCGAYRVYRNNVPGIRGDFCSALHADERNFLHNGRGERLYSTQSWQENSGTQTVYIYLMNPASPAWRQYFAAGARENLESLRYSGLFLDNVDVSLYRAKRQEVNSDGIVAEYASESDYRSAVEGFLASLRSELGTARVWANTTGAYDSPWYEDGYLPYLDGVMNEHFVARWSGTFANPMVWEYQVSQAEKVGALGKTYLAVAQGTKADAARMRFALASYLLVARAHVHLRYASDATYDQAWLYDDFDTRLGDPLGNRYQAGGLWRRDFACGSVAVDVASHVGTITTDPTRPGCA